jgi:hypothetical protein
MVNPTDWRDRERRAKGRGGDSVSSRSREDRTVRSRSQVLLKSVTHPDTQIRAGLHGYAFWQVSGCFDALTSTFRNAPSALKRRISLLLTDPRWFRHSGEVVALIARRVRSRWRSSWPRLLPYFYQNAICRADSLDAPDAVDAQSRRSRSKHVLLQGSSQLGRLA